jgi:predicted transposase YbfD/YdcC
MVELVSGLNLKGCVATVDAMGCNDKMAAAILSSEGDYVMQLKENQPLTEAWAVEYFAKNQGEPDHAHPSSKERRGVVERECFVLANASKWAGQGVMNFQGAKSIALMRKTISKKGCADVVEMRYYASSLTDPALISQSIRSHWGVENGLHWTLDLRFGEDANLVRDKAAQKNLGLIRKLVLNAFKGRKMINYSKYMKKLQCSPEALEEELYMMRPSKAYPKI